MRRPPTWRPGIGFLLMPLLSSCDWPIDPDLNPGENVNIRVQMAFTNFHDDVTASWSGQQVSLGVWTADDFTGRTSVTNAALPGSVDVIPPQVVQFPVENDIFPGIWEVSVQAYEDGALFLDVTCTQLDIGGNMIAPGETYTVQVFENGLCEAELGDIDPPAPPDRDAEALDLSAPASAVIGDVVPLAVDIRNNGELLQEIIAVDFRYRPPGGGNAIDIDSVTPLVDPSTTETVAIDWDTTCLAPEGDYLVEATVSVAGDSVANNSQSAVVDLAADREVNLENLAAAKGMEVGDLVVLILDRPRHEDGRIARLRDNTPPSAACHSGRGNGPGSGKERRPRQSRGYRKPDAARVPICLRRTRLPRPQTPHAT